MSNTAIISLTDEEMQKLQRLAEQTNRRPIDVLRAPITQLFQAVPAMQQSDAYLSILDEGSLMEAKKLLLRLGRKTLGVPDESVTAAVEGITDLERLERMHDRVGEVKTWQELLATP